MNIIRLNSYEPEPSIIRLQIRDAVSIAAHDIEMLVIDWFAIKDKVINGSCYKSLIICDRIDLTYYCKKLCANGFATAAYHTF